MKKPKNKIPINDFFFHNIDTQEKAYMLGIMYSDGCVWESKDKKGCIQLKMNDLDAIENFKNVLESQHNIRIEKDGYRLIFKSRQMFNDLVRQGCVPNKSFIIKFPPIQDVELIWSFIFGIIDGDGTIKISKTRQVSINIYSASKEFLIELNNFFTSQNLNPRLYIEKERKDNTYCIYLGRKEEVKKIFKIWEKQPVKMKRKFQKLKNYFN